MDEITILRPSEFPPLLSEIPDPPKQLWIRGELPKEDIKWLCVVGSRKYTPYGKDTCERLIAGLRGYPVGIISGLALGVDAIAHKAALSIGLPTIAVPGSGLNWDAIGPKTNLPLARSIVKSGGVLLSDYEPDFKPTIWSFPKRNRIMAGLSHAVLVVESSKKSGTLITARLAMEYNRDVLAVPGSIFSKNTEGTHALIKDGAAIARSSEDILETLGLAQQTKTKNTQPGNLSKNEKRVVELLREPIARDELIRALQMPVHEANILLSAMELKGIIVERLGKVHLQ